MRDASRDGGFLARLFVWFLRNFALLWRAIERWDWLARRVNRFLINFVVNRTRNRPHPWSTVSDYTSWRSLTDRNYFARHLQATDFLPNPPPPVAAVTALFVRPQNLPPNDPLLASPKSTMLFPVFAQYLTDSFLRTVMNNRSRTTSTHEIDLSALYGRTEAQTNVLRLQNPALGMRGRLKSQIVNGEEYPEYLFEADGITVRQQFMANGQPVLDHPLGHDPGLPQVDQRRIFAVGGDRVNVTPQVAMINTLFLREHNRIAGLIEQAYPRWDDEKVFQTARNILIPMYLTIVIEEYINHISSLAFRLRADLSMAWRARWNRPNWMAVEFNLLYRWHSLIPDIIQWNGQNVPAADMQLDNRFLINAGVAAGLHSCSSQPACVLGLFNTAAFLHDPNRDVERRTIDQGRQLRVARYNDYRQAFGMQRVDSFAQITGDANRAAALQNVYGNPDNIEFYTGLCAEDLMPNSPLPPLMGRMLGVDAFSQALTNPLLSEHVFNSTTFTQLGWDLIHQTRTLRSVADRNIPGGLGNGLVTMTRPGWQRIWAPF